MFKNQQIASIIRAIINTNLRVDLAINALEGAKEELRKSRKELVNLEEYVKTIPLEPVAIAEHDILWKKY